MRGSLKLFTWFGIPVFVHWTFALIFLYAFWIGYDNNLGPFEMLWVFAFLIPLFGFVLLHEYGHALTARRYGVETKDIILTPIGGIARLERMPEKPVQEFFVAIAGPAVNVAIAFILFGVGMLLFNGIHWEIFTATIRDYFSSIGLFFQHLWTLVSGQVSLSEFKILLDVQAPSELEEIRAETGVEAGVLLVALPAFLSINLGLALFNLLPAFPMDGGRVLRALLAVRFGRVIATQWASWIGQAVAVIFIAMGFLVGNFTLGLIGFFVFMNARTENVMVRLDALLKRYKARDIMRPNFTRLHVTDWMQTPVELIQQGLERHFLVFDMSDRLVGVLEEDDILAAMKKHDLSSEIAKYVQKVELVHINEPLQTIYFFLRQGGHAIVGVMDQGELVGVIDDVGLRHFLRLQSGTAR
ncbi:MAG TPA: site-2 protease family protein [Saprospiraceae bacterium]|nr:site-2 protease family protein [Saprospiraceae bacterium]